MRHLPTAVWLIVLTGAMSAGESAAQSDTHRLAEAFDPGAKYAVEVRVEMAGQVQVPGEKDKPPKNVPTAGGSVTRYVERVLPPDEDKAAKVLRQYRELTFKRVI